MSEPVPISVLCGHASLDSAAAVHIAALVPTEPIEKPFCSLRLRVAGSELSVGNGPALNFTFEAACVASGLSEARTVPDWLAAVATPAPISIDRIVKLVRALRILILYTEKSLSGSGRHQMRRRRTPARYRPSRSEPLSAGDSFAQRAQTLALESMPKVWLYTQIAIIVFVLAGIVIAITKLA